MIMCVPISGPGISIKFKRTYPHFRWITSCRSCAEVQAEKFGKGISENVSSIQINTSVMIFGEGNRYGSVTGKVNGPSLKKKSTSVLFFRKAPGLVSNYHILMLSFFRNKFL